MNRYTALLLSTILALLLAGSSASANGLGKAEKAGSTTNGATAAEALATGGAWTPRATEFTRVQAGDWLDDTRFVVGRWDGSLSVFRMPRSDEFTPVLLDVLATSQGDGVEMVLALDGQTVLASNSATQLMLWQPGPSASIRKFEYDSVYGIANSSVVYTRSGRQTVVTGHANGYVLAWSFDGTRLVQEQVVDARSPNPIQSPYPLKNVRGLAHWRDDLVIAGSEDGDLTIIDVKTGAIMARQRYNPTAQRGVNNISISEDLLLVANCSVGKADHNLWLFRVSDTGFERLDAANLIEDMTRPQSFNFDADLAPDGDTLRFFASTEEGLLWAGAIIDDELVIQRKVKVASDGGAFIDVHSTSNIFLAAARKLYLFAFP